MRAPPSRRRWPAASFDIARREGVRGAGAPLGLKPWKPWSAPQDPAALKPWKPWRTLQARAALAGFEAPLIETDDGRLALVVSRGAMTRSFADLQDLEDWLSLVEPPRS